MFFCFFYEFCYEKESDVGNRYLVIEIESQTCYDKTNKLEMTNLKKINLFHINFNHRTLSMSSSTEYKIRIKKSTSCFLGEVLVENGCRRSYITRISTGNLNQNNADQLNTDWVSESSNVHSFVCVRSLSIRNS